MDNDDVISTLNDLIETSKDGEDGFRTCADDVSTNELKAFFVKRAQLCAAAVVELQDLVRAYGGTPETSGGLGAAVHRRWIRVKAAVQGKDVHAGPQAYESGEGFPGSHFQRALEKNLPADVRHVVERQYQGVVQNHDEVRRLRDQYRSG